MEVDGCGGTFLFFDSKYRLWVCFCWYSRRVLEVRVMFFLVLDLMEGASEEGGLLVAEASR